ncbi:hypothetical protein [Allostreptomyces psammosilenae]|uniref:DUF3817 domain-containing protein n=1 Tax=Allostreptomyces psammosilenae TaxID=1892865 RepID=A0A853A5M1_9ACTN|nr:hypothetical protein [Allostreptomyces psammosilenae]NYI05792.1 hypothetical protein [Allostreptomyces psammosilenae]
MRTLRIAAGVEAASLALMLLNLFTVHVEAASSLLGPLHGTAYLVVIATAWPAANATGAGPGARWLAVIPGIGGLLALRRLDAHAAANRTSTPQPTGE